MKYNGGLALTLCLLFTTTTLAVPVSIKPDVIVAHKLLDQMQTPMECDGCKWFIGKSQEFLKTRESRLENITEGVLESGICSHLPTTEGAYCNNLIEKYVPFAFDSIVTKLLDPAFICSEVIPLCSETSLFQDHQLEKNSQTTTACHSAVQSVSEYLSQKSSYEKIAESIDTNCVHENPLERFACKAVANNVTVAVLDEILKLAFNGKMVCDDESSSYIFESTHSRKLLGILNKRSPPPPPPTPKPAPAPAPAPKPKTVPAPAPKPAPVPAPAPKPAPVPAPAPKSAPVPAPAPKPKAVPAPAPAPAPKAPSEPAPKSVSSAAVAGVAAAAVVTVAAAVQARDLMSVYSIYMTCDNEFDLYVNGNKIGRGTSWTTTYTFSPLVNLGDVIAIDGVDQGGPAAFIGVFGGKVTKPADWRCSTKETAGWNKNNFDDSTWTKAVSYGRNQDNNIWRSVGGGSRPNIPADAEWLWTSDNNNHNRVYCRYFPMPAPKAVPVVSAPKAVPVVAAPKAVPVVAAPKAVADAPVADAPDADAPDADAPVADAPVADAPAAAKDDDYSPLAKEQAVDEIIKSIPKTNMKLKQFQEKLMTFITETNNEQVKIETENRNNFNGVSVTLQNEQLRLESARKSMKTLYAETERLNATIQSHYKKLIADTSYLQSLDAMRPAFLKSLGELATHIAAVASTVDKKIYKDEYKDEMMGLLTDIHSNAYNVSGYVAAAFINHYNKYKALIQKENVDYSSELKQLTVLSNNYKIQAQKSADIEKERARLQDILSKLKATLTLSVSQRDDFDRLVKDVVAIFDKKCGGIRPPTAELRSVARISAAKR